MSGNAARAVRVIGGVGLLSILAACSVTQRAKPELPRGRCALIQPNVCSQLTPGPPGGAALRYIASDVQWAQYTTVMINPVTVWGSETPTVAPSDAQAAADYLYNAFVKAFQSKFRVVDGPGKAMDYWAQTSVDRLIALQSSGH